MQLCFCCPCHCCYRCYHCHRCHRCHCCHCCQIRRRRRRHHHQCLIWTLPLEHNHQMAEYLWLFPEHALYLNHILQWQNHNVRWIYLTVVFRNHLQTHFPPWADMDDMDDMDDDVYCYSLHCYDFVFVCIIAYVSFFYSMMQCLYLYLVFFFLWKGWEKQMTMGFFRRESHRCVIFSSPSVANELFQTLV